MFHARQLRRQKKKWITAHTHIQSSFMWRRRKTVHQKLLISLLPTSLPLLNSKHTCRDTKCKTKSNPLKTKRATEIYFKIVCEMVWQRRHQQKPNHTHTHTHHVLCSLFFLKFFRRPRYTSSHFSICMKIEKCMIEIVAMKTHPVHGMFQNGEDGEEILRRNSKRCFCQQNWKISTLLTWFKCSFILLLKLPVW